MESKWGRVGGRPRTTASCFTEFLTVRERHQLAFVACILVNFAHFQLYGDKDEAVWASEGSSVSLSKVPSRVQEKANGEYLSNPLTKL